MKEKHDCEQFKQYKEDYGSDYIEKNVNGWVFGVEVACGWESGGKDIDIKYCPFCGKEL